MAYDISIDPGTNHCGFCVWFDGKPFQTGTFHSPVGLTYEEKALWLKGRFVKLFQELDAVGTGRPIRQVAVERFPTFHSKEKEMSATTNKHSMMMCAGIQMLLFSLADEWSRVTPVRVSKGKTSKAEAMLMARSLGVITKSKDLADAVQIGVAAGFDKRKGE